MKNIFLITLLTCQTIMPSIHKNYTPEIYSTKQLSQAEIRSISPLQHLKMAWHKFRNTRTITDELKNTIFHNLNDYHPLTAQANAYNAASRDAFSPNVDNQAVTANAHKKIALYHDFIFEETAHRASIADHIKNAFKSLKYRYWTPRFNKQEHEKIDTQMHQETSDNNYALLTKILKKDLDSSDARDVIEQISDNKEELPKPTDLTTLFSLYKNYPEELDAFIIAITNSKYTAQEQLEIFKNLKNEPYLKKEKFTDVLKRIEYKINDIASLLAITDSNRITYNFYSIKKTA